MSEGKVNLIVQSKVKEYIKQVGEDHSVAMLAGDALDSLNEKVHHLIEEAVKRASSNGRKTVRSSDF